MIGMFCDIFIKNEEGITIENNRYLKKFFKYIIYPVIIFCILVSYIVIKYDNTILRYVVIPFCIIVIIVLKIKVKSELSKYNTYKFKVNSQYIKYYVEKELLEIPIIQIVSIEDKSFYYQYNDSTRYNWHHEIRVKIKNGEDFINNNNIKTLLLAYKYFKDEDYVEISISDLILKHEDYLKLLEFIEGMLEKNI